MRKLLAAVITLSLAPLCAVAEDATPPGAPAPDAPVAPAVAAPVAAPVAPVAPAAPTATLAAATGNADQEVQSAGFHMGVGVDNAMSNSVFFGPYKSPTLGSSVMLAPAYSFKLGHTKLGASARASFAYEYTDPDNETGRKWEYSDIGLSVSAPAIFKDEKFTGISISPRLSATLPVSWASRWRGTITNLNAGVGLSREFGKFHTGLSLGLGHTFYASGTRTFTDAELSQRDDASNPIYVCRTDSGACGLRGTPTLWAAAVGGEVGWSPLDNLSVGVGLNFSKAQKFSVTQSGQLDEYSSTKTTNSGQRVVVAAAQADQMIGTVSVAYQLTPLVGLSLGMGTSQAPLSKDDKSFNFPWFNFRGASGEYTQYSLGLNASF